MPSIARRVVIAGESVVRVREAVRAAPGWVLKERRRHLRGPIPEGMLILDVPTEDGPVEVQVVVEDRPPRLLLQAFIIDAGDGWEEHEKAHRAHLRFIYTRLRTACPELPPWSEMDETVHDNRGWGRGPGLQFSWVFVVMLLFLFGAIAVRCLRD